MALYFDEHLIPNQLRQMAEDWEGLLPNVPDERTRRSMCRAIAAWRSAALAHEQLITPRTRAENAAKNRLLAKYQALRK